MSAKVTARDLEYRGAQGMVLPPRYKMITNIFQYATNFIWIDVFNITSIEKKNELSFAWQGWTDAEPAGPVFLRDCAPLQEEILKYLRAL